MRTPGMRSARAVYKTDKRRYPMKRAIVVLANLAMILSLVAVSCAPAVTPTSEVVKETVIVKETVVVEPTPVPEEKPPWWVPEGEEVTLSYWFCMTEKEAAEREELKRFEEEHPRIKVDLSVTPCGEFDVKAKSAFAAGNPPDVFVWAADGLWDYGEEGLLVDLGPFFERDLNLDDFYAPVKELIQARDGTYYGMGRNWVVGLLFYNQNLFDEAGLSYPDESWTWQDYREAAKALTKDVDGDGRIDQYGTFISPNFLQGDPIIWSFGGRVYDPADNKVHFSDPESIEALQFLADFILEDKSAPQRAVVSTWGEMREDPFKTGSVGMNINGAWMLGRYADLTEFNWGVAPLPKGPEGRFCYGGADTLFISKHAEDRGVAEQAWELMRWLISPEGGISWYTVNIAHMPGNSKIAESSEYRAAVAPYADTIEVMKYSQQFVVVPFTKYWREWRAKVDSLLTDGFYGMMSMEDAVNLADEETNAILEEW